MTGKEDQVDFLPPRCQDGGRSASLRGVFKGSSDDFGNLSTSLKMLILRQVMEAFIQYEWKRCFSHRLLVFRPGSIWAFLFIPVRWQRRFPCDTNLLTCHVKARFFSQFDLVAKDKIEGDKERIMEGI